MEAEICLDEVDELLWSNKIDDFVAPEQPHGRLKPKLGQISMRHILHQQYDAVGSHTVQEAKHNPNPNRL